MLHNQLTILIPRNGLVYCFVHFTLYFKMVMYGYCFNYGRKILFIRRGLVIMKTDID